MRLFFLSIFFLLFFFSQALFVNFTRADCVITSTLRVGSTGIEVECMQVAVGATKDGKFGPLTKLAVMAFQSSKGLVADGIVGSKTRTALNGSVTNNGIYPPGCTGTVGYSATTGAKCDSSLSPLVPVPLTDDTNLIPLVVNNDNNAENINPNLVKMDKFIETVIEVNKKKGSSEQELQTMASALRKEIIESDMDYEKEFKEIIVKEGKLLSANFQTQSPLTVFDKILEKTLSFFGINPPKARAQGLPFGGPLFFAFYCAYNDTWMIDLLPLPPTEIAVISYVEGTQGFGYYTIPFTTWLLGDYIPVGVCIIPGYPVIVIPTEGTMSPMVGSSFL